MLCDFIDNSSTFNEASIDIPGIGIIPILENPLTGKTRDTGDDLSHDLN